jgi:hypothetical protein
VDDVYVDSAVVDAAGVLSRRAAEVDPAPEGMRVS